MRSLWILLWVVTASAASAQSRRGQPERPRDLTEGQVVAAIEHAERLLASGEHCAAMTRLHRVSETLFEANNIDLVTARALDARDRSASWIAVVRMKGTVDLYCQPVAPEQRRKLLLLAEERLRELGDNRLAVARHAESLAALGDRMPEAYEKLLALHKAGEITEPETYAAFHAAARATRHPKAAASAAAACLKRAGHRAEGVCPPRAP